MANANPKRLFGTICSAEVLPRLGRMKMIGSESQQQPANGGDASDGKGKKEETTTTPSSTTTGRLVQDILWGGMFHPTNHMDGFRTMRELQTMPPLPKLLSSGEEEEEKQGGDDDEDQAEDEVGGGKETKKGKTGSQKSCFQSSLFASLQTLLTSNENDDDKRNATATANLLPAIAKGFFERIRSYAQRTARSGSTSEADAKLQFRFWCRVVSPALERLFLPPSSDDDGAGNSNGELAIALLEAASETLGLVLEYDAYLPSYSDPEELHLGFLERVTKGLLRFIDGNSLRDDDESESDQRVQALVTSFRQIILLNHRLLHEKLSDVISFACSCLPDARRCDPSRQKSVQQANALLSSVVKIYRELRQAGYFLTSARGAFAAHDASQAASTTDNDGVGFMANLLNCTHVMESLALAYQSCPSGQLHEIWDLFDGWIVDVVVGSEEFSDQPDTSEVVGVTGAATTELSFAVQMFIIFIKNIRSNKQNSPELRGLCEKSMTTSISKLLGKTQGASPSISADSEGNHGFLMLQGFDLCGWLVDLHTRSCFWIDSIDVDGDGSSFLLAQKSDDADELNVLAYLRNVAETTVSADRFKTWKTSWFKSYWESAGDSDSLEGFSDIGVPALLRGSLQRLALHRVHQLHSMIYYCNLQENERDASDIKDDPSSSQALTEEAKMLVEFALYIACSQITAPSNLDDAAQGSSESLWSPVAQSLCIWTHYSDTYQVELFLIWFFTTLCQKNALAQTTQMLQLEKTIALTLAKDASFYDVSKVMSMFMKVGLRFAFRQFLDGIDTIDKLPEKITQESSGLTDACMELALKESTKLSVEKHGYVDTVSTALSFLASAPLELTLRNDNLSLLDRVVGLDSLVSQVIKNAQGVCDCDDPRLLNVIRATKTIMANILPKTLLFSSDVNASCLVNLASQLFKTCVDFRFDSGILYASTDAIGEYFSMCIDYHEKNSSMLEKFLGEMETTVGGADESDFVSNALLIRSVIQRMNILDRRNSLPKKTSTDSTTSPYELCLRFIQTVQKNLQNMMFQHITNAGSGENYSEAAATALLLESDIMSFVGHHLAVTPESNLMTSEQIEVFEEGVRKIFQLVKHAQGSNNCLDLAESSRYFLSSMAATPTYFLGCVSSSAALESILQAMAISYEHGKETLLLDSALCSLIRKLDLGQTEIITTYVLSEPDDGKRHDPAFVVKIFHLLMTCANSPEQHNHISGRCKAFLLISMGLLRDRTSSSSRCVSNVALYSKAMTTLISKKELLLLSGREIAMICCEMSPLFHGNDYGFDEDDAVFKCCCSVIASLVAHYPKQLYGCPSPLFSLLLALLSHILHTSAKKGLSQKTLEFAKVCELLMPHKDIFKKHVVGLILCYVQALNRGMNPTTKSKLMPSIYALLDMCSDFETRQINAMIDVSSKALFAPVFQSYRKFYQYHGQA